MMGWCIKLVAVGLVWGGLLFGLLGMTPILASPALDQDLPALLDSLIMEQMEIYHIANATVSVVAGGEVLFTKGYGYQDDERRIPVDGEQSLFRVGSTSKLVTWTAVMQLVEQGKLDLDRDVNAYLDFSIPARLIHDTAEAEPITLRHLMTHTAGFEAYLSGTFYVAEERLLPLAQYARQMLPARAFPAGEVIAYSNYGSTLAGYIVERVSGVPFAQYVEENILTPLGMENSTFRQPLPQQLATNLAKPYRFVDGEFRQARFEYMNEPAGSMSSTAADMARFMLAHLQGGELHGVQILSQETVEVMHSPLFSYHSRLHGMAHGFVEGRFNGRRTLFHPGGTMLYDTALYLVPEEDIGFFMSHSGGNHLVNIRVFQAVMDQYFPAADEASVPSPTPGMAERSRALVGEYQQNQRSFTTSDKILALMMGLLRVDVDEAGYLLVGRQGETHRFVELEPGVYKNVREERTLDYSGDFRYVVFGTDPLGNSMLMVDGPMSYSRAAWYEQSTLNLLALAVSVVFVVASLLCWVIKAVIQRVRRYRGRRPRRPKRAVLVAARWAALAFGFLTLVFVLEFLMVSEPDPVYVLPAAAYGEVPSWSWLTDLVIPWLMAIVGVVVAVFAVVAWKKRYWTILARVHYTFFALAALLLIWIFGYWNVLQM